jgi:tetratricopeptide (TPR) repeat protein
MPSSAITLEKLAQARASLKEPLVATEICLEILATQSHEPPTLELIEVHYLLGVSLRLAGRLDEAFNELLYAKEVAVLHKEEQLTADSSVELGLLAIEQSRTDDAITLIKDAIKLYAKLGLNIREAKAIFALANAYGVKGEHGEALKYTECALTKFTDANFEDGIVAVLCALVQIDIARGREQEAEDRIALCFKLLPSHAHGNNRIFLQLTLAECMHKRGKSERAFKIFRGTTEDAKSDGLYFLEARSRLMLHNILQERGDDTEASEQLALAEQLAEENGFTDALNKLKEEAN